MTQLHEYLMHAVYFAPRGKKRLHELGSHIAQRYLSADDLLIGVIGDSGAGKSLLIQGMFPGLELTSDDEGVNVRPLPLLFDAERGSFEHHTYHLDMLWELAFSSMDALAEATKKALGEGCRVVVEHFELLYQYLGRNAQILVGIGEEVIIARPGLFGPYPEEIKSIVYPSLQYRKMAHSAEDITLKILGQMGVPSPDDHGDVRHGFMLRYSNKPQVDLNLVEKLVLEVIEKDLPITPKGSRKIAIGDDIIRCSGPRIHVKSTGEIRNFRLIKEYLYDSLLGEYSIVGLVGEEPHSFWSSGERKLFEHAPELNDN